MKKLLHKLLFPKKAVVVISVPVASALLVYTFAVAGEESPVAYISYVFSAWTLTVFCLAIVPLFSKSREAVHNNKYAHRYLTDVQFKMRVSLYGALGINTLYAVLKLVSGIYYGSVWLITLGVYYFSLAVIRFLLLHHVNRNTVGKNMVSEWRRYRLCGILLLLMNIAMTGMVILVISKNEGFSYAGYLIYVMAMYAFYATVMAVVNIVRYRKLGSPVLSAAKAISLASALVSMLALETAMLEQFGERSPEFRQRMTGSTGAVVCTFVLTMAIYMIVKSTKSLEKLDRDGKERI